MKLPNSLFLELTSNWAIGQTTTYAIYSAGSNSTAGSDSLDRGKTGSPLGVASTKYFPRCDAPGAPYRYSTTHELTLPDTTSSTKVAQYLDVLAMWDTEGPDDFHIHDCDNNLKFVLHAWVTTHQNSYYVWWTINDAADKHALAVTSNWVSLYDSPNITLIAPKTNATIAQLLQFTPDSCSRICDSDTWNILAEQPGVVKPSVLALIALRTKRYQTMFY
jgi:hypothetical protein